MTDLEPLQPDLSSCVKIRIEGQPADVEIIAAALAALFRVSESSRDYQNRGSNRVRRYLTVETSE